MKDKIVPDLQAALLCEDVRMEASGSNSLVGVINVVAAPVMPIRILKLCVFTRWCSGIGKYHQRTRILHPNDEDEIANAQASFKLQNETNHATNVNVFGGLEFAEAGDYPIEIYLDGDLKLRFALKIILTQNKKNQPS